MQYKFQYSIIARIGGNLFYNALEEQDLVKDSPEPNALLSKDFDELLPHLISRSPSIAF